MNHPFQQRVIEEKQELDEKIGKLNLFLVTNTCCNLPQEERNRLIRQEQVMSEYSKILGERITAFQQFSTEEKNKLKDPNGIWYGPHPCEHCGLEVISLSKDQGYLVLDAPFEHHYPNHVWGKHHCESKKIN